MSKTTNPLKKILAPARRFTFDSFIRTSQNKNSTLPALLHKFPNFGLGFKITNFGNEKDYWTIDQVKPMSNRHADIFALKYDKNGPAEKIEKMRNIYKEKLYDFEIFMYSPEVKIECQPL